MTTFEDYEELIFLNLYKFLMLDTVYIYIFILLFVTWGSESVDPRNCWRQQSYAIKNQLGHP